MVRKAEMKDLDRIEEIYDAIHEEILTGENTANWPYRVYPSREVAEEGILAGTMYVTCDEQGTIWAAGIINNEQSDEYYGQNWQIEADGEEVFVIHTLVCHPAYRKHGAATELLNFEEELARSKGAKCLRIDTSEFNTPGLRLYKSLGYKLIDDSTGFQTEVKTEVLVTLEKVL